MLMWYDMIPEQRFVNEAFGTKPAALEEAIAEVDSLLAT